MDYGVIFTDTALKNMQRFPKKDQQHIMARIEQLAVNPDAAPNGKRLIAFDVSYRLRVGNFRVLFDRDDII